MATHAGDDYYVFTSTGTIQAQSDPVLALAAVNKFLGQLGDKAVWVRVAEVIIGLALIIVGLDKALAGTAGGSAAHAVAKGAFLA
jgi:hypothetical protein